LLVPLVESLVVAATGRASVQTPISGMSKN
jgi:hypothetical protein